MYVFKLIHATLKYPHARPHAVKPQRAAEKLGHDLRQCLEVQIGKTGEINTEYGGFEITVSEPAYFPWHDCLATLLNYGYEVWVSKKRDRIVIIAKPMED